MVTWLDVAVVAFFAQLAELPGEKVQLIIAGLATRYDPRLVVAAAGSAFAGWTAVEVAFGAYVQRVVPAVHLNVGTGLLFLAFAAMVLRSAPDRARLEPATDGGEPSSARRTSTDRSVGGEPSSPTRASTDQLSDRLQGGAAAELDVRVPVVGWRVPAVRGGFLPIFALMAFGEFGDKTQLVTIGLAAQYAYPAAIWAGEMAAILPVSLLNAYVFFTFTDRFDVRKLHLASAALFAFFGIDTLQALLTGVSVWKQVGAILAALVAG